MPTILHVEDNADDVALFALGARRAGANPVVRTVGSGSEAIDYLEGRGRYADRSQWPFPDLILLDLKLPEFDGLEFLAWLNASSFSYLPVVVFTGTTDQKLLRDAASLGALTVIEKPFELAEMASVVRDLCAFELPRPPRTCPPSNPDGPVSPKE